MRKHARHSLFLQSLKPDWKLWTGTSSIVSLNCHLPWCDGLLPTSIQNSLALVKTLIIVALLDREPAVPLLY